MLARLRAQLTYANVVATLALFLALGGASYAAIRVTSGSIVNNTVRTQDLRNNDIRGRDIRNRTIVGRDILSNQITGLLVRESSLSKVPDSDSLDGQDSTALKAELKTKCPTGTTAHAGACIETSSRTADSAPDAARTCGTANRRLPLWSELESFRQEPGITLTSDEWLAHNVSVANTFTLDDSGTRASVLDSLNRGFRCVAPLSN